MNLFANVALPIIILMALGFGLPYLWALILPEGIPGLVANFVLSALILSLVVFAYFIAFYAGQNVPLVADLLQSPSAIWGAFTPYYLRWAGKTALVWAPVLVLGIAAQPKRWKEVVW